MRENLIELVHNARMNALWHNAKKPSEYIADMLIANDVVPVVRCKDCRFGDMCSIREAMCCTVPDGFCWRGERKDND